MRVKAYIVDSTVEKWELENILEEDGISNYRMKIIENWGLAPIVAYVIKGLSDEEGSLLESKLLTLNYLWACHPGIKQEQAKYWVYEMFSYFNLLYMVSKTFGYPIL